MGQRNAVVLRSVKKTAQVVWRVSGPPACLSGLWLNLSAPTELTGICFWRYKQAQPSQKATKAVEFETCCCELVGHFCLGKGWTSGGDGLHHSTPNLLAHLANEQNSIDKEPCLLSESGSDTFNSTGNLPWVPGQSIAHKVQPAYYIRHNSGCFWPKNKKVSFQLWPAACSKPNKDCICPSLCRLSTH